MDLKDWLNDTRGGNGFIVGLILVIFGCIVYIGFLMNRDSGPNRADDELIALTEKFKAEQALTMAEQSVIADSITEAEHQLYLKSLAEADSIAEAAYRKEQDSLAAVAAKLAPKPKIKPKPKPKPKKVTPEEIVIKRLKEGLSVGKIARETGLKRKYIRNIKKKEKL